MGFYIETPESQGKARQLFKLHGALPVYDPLKFDLNGPDALICVVSNGPFDAAGVIFSDAERDAFNEPDDPRSKTWLSLPKSKVLELIPHIKGVGVFAD